MNIKEKLQFGEEVYGTWCMLPSPEVIDVIAKSGLDFVIIDMEHGSMDYTTAQRMTTSAQSEGCSAIIRTPRKDASNILKSLDIGSDGIIIPHVNSKSDVDNCIQYSKYPPIGNRSYSPYTRCGGYKTYPEYFNNSNHDSFVSIIIEDKEGLDNIESIVSSPHIDMVYVGTYDIASSLGCSVDDSKVLDELKRCTKIIKKHNKSVGCLFHNKEELKFFQDIGVNFLVYGVDSRIIYNEYLKVKNDE